MKNIIIFKLKGRESHRDIVFCASQITSINQYLADFQRKHGSDESFINKMKKAFIDGKSDCFPFITRTYSKEEVDARFSNLKERTLAEEMLMNNTNNDVIVTDQRSGKTVSYKFPDVSTYEIENEETFLKLRQAVFNKLSPFWQTEEYQYCRTDFVIYLPVSHFSVVQFQIDEIIKEFG